jgi:two-component system response regulator AtoC
MDNLMRDETIVVGDDELECRKFLEMSLRHQGYGVELATNGDEVLDCLQSGNQVSAVLLDIFMPGRNGFETLLQIRSSNKDLPVIMLSGASSTEHIVTAMKSGATDFLKKPLAHDELQTALKNALQSRTVNIEGNDNKLAVDPIRGWSQEVQGLYAMADLVAPSDASVLIRGETGSGKEVLARYIHSRSRRAKQPFVKLNCAALPSELVESELFGYERGAFTGAYQRKPGMFELANGGTLLLDEIGDMDFKLQAKLLQVLQDHEFQRLGGKETVRVDVRVMAATHADLEKSIATSKFREDLYYRLNVVNLFVPPLRERREDILRLTTLLAEKHGFEDLNALGVTPALRHALLLYDWPGNVRELENVVRKLAALRDAGMIVSDLTARAARKTLMTAPSLDVGCGHDGVEISAPILQQVTKAKHQAETEAILATLSSTHWNRKKAAALLKIDYKALLYKMKKLGIEDKLALLPEVFPASEPRLGKAQAAGQSD